MRGVAFCISDAPLLDDFIVLTNRDKRHCIGVYQIQFGFRNELNWAWFLMLKKQGGKMRKNKIERLIGASGAVGLGILTLALFACPGFSGAEAVGEYTGITNEADAVVASNDVGIANKVWVKPTISIALGSTEIELDTAKSVNNFVSGTANLKVSTNSTRGFKVLINSVGSASLVATDDSRNLIPPIPTKSTADKFPSTGGWGYYADVTAPNAGSEYYPTSTSAVVVKETDTSAAINDYKVGIGVKIDSTTPIGNYQNQLVVSVLANPIAAFNLAHITKMQEMTPEICAATPEYVDVNNYAWKTLIDSRDNKTYKVAKLADKNCWMIQYLALDLGKELTSTDTDLAPDRKVTLPATTTATSTSGSNDGMESRHPNAYWYYQWRAAVADSGTTSTITTDGQEASDSICPKGWQLPKAGPKYNTITKSGNPDKQLGSGSFNDLLVSYKIVDNPTMISIGEVAPLSFIRNGYITNGIQNVGIEGCPWSSVAASNINAYRLVWYSDRPSGFSTSNPLARSYAFPIRCVARQKLR